MGNVRRIHFHCVKCEMVRTIETPGEVWVGPWCPNCGIRMKPLELKQITLGLVFDESGAP